MTKYKISQKTAPFLKKKKQWDFISVKWLHASNVREAQTKPLQLVYFQQTSKFKVLVKENEVPTEKNSIRASIFATKASYISN